MIDENKKQQMYKNMNARKDEVNFVRKIVGYVTLAILAIVLLVGVGGYLYVKSALKPVDPDSTEKIAVEVPIGSGIALISKELEKKGVIKSARIFKYYTKFKNESSFQAGTYDLTKSMTLDEIIESLKTGTIYREPLSTITIPEGLTLDQIGSIIAKHTDYTEKQFMSLVTSDAFIQKMQTQYPELLTDAINNENIRYKLEGYLYPATYPLFDEKPSLESIVKLMLDTMNKTVMQYKGLMQEREMTVHELITFASLLEREATAQTDRETIASVFYNRIKEDMPLQTDPTVLYALGEHKDVVLYKDLEVDNPYNTYQNKGLPPGPIAAPGDVSIQAALNPTTTEYLYFLADENGINHFAKTYEEHQENEKKYIKTK
ncbi:endolytic murein transglycosylase [Lysinibacillus alkalisoli]|uniref:Endolytic murein transglycosylase n=1 Tax=Lysinibacillus alkalisoli TaxID=1911548 RepID=A0A917LIP3_9BACI|nr:endolytic transglycosylase MltG [Lysinibacillus alkalisoli]GGG27103.1 endolytic murein transglycosylase [Lysinibacillus alkalisoli]